MAAGIVHELNQPIAAIRTHSASGRLLLDRHEEGKARESFLSVTRITDHMASITAQLKTFAYKTPRHCAPVLVQDCLTAALGLTETLLAEVGVVVETQQPTEPVMVNGDRNRIEQVLVNLIRNGVDAMRETEPRLLNLCVSIDRELVKIVLSDSGTGIEEENLSELFNPFFTTKEVGKGLGLGLSISYRIVADLGGTIRAMNNSGAGASFVVRLPTLTTETTGVQ
jgi:two-component system C4-dicarboxylate transport sensor histidine kinase DctB